MSVSLKGECAYYECFLRTLENLPNDDILVASCCRLADAPSLRKTKSGKLIENAAKEAPTPHLKTNPERLFCRSDAMLGSR